MWKCVFAPCLALALTLTSAVSRIQTYEYEVTRQTMHHAQPLHLEGLRCPLIQMPRPHGSVLLPAEIHFLGPLACCSFFSLAVCSSIYSTRTSQWIS